MAPSVITGSCLCGEIRYEVSGVPVTTLLCHCDNCRKCTGSSFMANSFYLKEVSISASLLIQIHTNLSIATPYYHWKRCSQSLRGQKPGIRPSSLPVVLFQLWFAFVHHQSRSPRRRKCSDRHFGHNGSRAFHKRVEASSGIFLSEAEGVAAILGRDDDP
jgi:hypothetical protein